MKSYCLKEYKELSGTTIQFMYDSDVQIEFTIT